MDEYTVWAANRRGNERLDLRNRQVRVEDPVAFAQGLGAGQSRPKAQARPGRRIEGARRAGVVEEGEQASVVAPALLEDPPQEPRNGGDSSALGRQGNGREAWPAHGAISPGSPISGSRGAMTGARRAPAPNVPM